MVEDASYHGTHRIAWLDNVKVLAGLLMALDHALLYFGYEGAWPRQSLTRVVEPLYVFVFGYLAAARHGPLPRQRGAVLILASVAEATLHSSREGQLRFGILTSLAMTWPLIPWLRHLPSTSLRAISVLGGIIALTPVSPSPLRFDYGPWLVLSQLSLAMLYQRQSAGLLWLLPATWLLHMMVVGSLATHGFPPHPNLSTLLIGHLLAITFIGIARRSERWKLPAPLLLIASRPLTFYLGHLTFFHFLNALVAITPRILCH